MTSLQQPYFLECNRSNSTILSENDDYNAIWSSDIAPFQLLPGDQVSVSSVAIEASSIGTPDTIEFTAEPVKVNNGYGAAISDPEDPMGLGIFGCKFWGLKRKEGSNSCENKK